MDWRTAVLERGEKYPEAVKWPKGMDAVIPVSDSILSRVPSTLVKMDSIALYWKEGGSGTRRPLVWMNEKGHQECAIDIPRWIFAVQNETYHSAHKKPIMAFFPFNYHFIPEAIRYRVIANLLQRRSHDASEMSKYPSSLLDVGCEILLGVCHARWNWGSNSPLLVLTHDIESGGGLEWSEKIATLEERFGFRSVWNVIPMRYSIKKDILHRLLDRGHEIGLHGLWHDCSEAFLEAERLRQEFERQRQFMREFLMEGYRSPSWYRTKTMLGVVGEYFRYDMSCLDNDVLCPSGKGGVGFVRPFKNSEGLVEFPCSLPFEAPLYFKIPSDAICEYWAPKIEFIKASAGMLLVTTHPEPHYLGSANVISQYENLLKGLADDGWRCALPREILQRMPQ